MIQPKTHQIEKNGDGLFRLKKPFDRGSYSTSYNRCGIPINLTKLIKSFLSNRNFLVKVTSSISLPRKIEAGVPQESRLSYLLYVIYINDLLFVPHTQVTLFTDDTMFYPKNKNYIYTIVPFKNN